MGKQLIIIEASGTFNPGLITDLVSIANRAGLEIYHSSVLYDGQTHFMHGTGEDLAKSLAAIGTVVEVSKSASAAVEGGQAQVIDLLNDIREKIDALGGDKPRIRAARTPKKEPGDKNEGAGSDTGSDAGDSSSPSEGAGAGSDTSAEAAADS